MRKLLVIGAVLVLVAGGCRAEERFKDVPKDHWAAEAVNKLADAGVLKGYPDGTFKGEKTVTRYELAAALSSMIQFIQQSRKPLAQETKPATPKNWAEASTAFLKSGGYLPKDSPLLKDGTKPVTPDELANALASVATKLIEQDVKEPKTQ
jgi:hypothetical protein